MNNKFIICVLIVSIIFISGCTGTSIGNNNIKIQKELKTPDGITVKIELAEEKVQIGKNEYESRKIVNGLLENPTNSELKKFRAGILIKYIDENDLDRNSAWMTRSGTGRLGIYTTVEPQHKLPLDFDEAYLGSNYISDSTLEIQPYFNLAGGTMYPPCFEDDPRKDCYELKFVPGEGWIDVPKTT